MQRLLLTAVTASLMAWPLLAQPAAPPPEPRLNCPLEGVTAEQRALAASASSEQLTDAPSEGAQQGRAAMDAIAANVQRCAASAHWTENQQDLALQYTFMQLTREDMLRRYDAQHVDLRFIDEAVASSEPGVRLPFDDLVARVRAQGVGDDRPDSAGDIVYIYMMLAYQTAAIRAGFADPNFTMR